MANLAFSERLQILLSCTKVNPCVQIRKNVVAENLTRKVHSFTQGRSRKIVAQSAQKKVCLVCKEYYYRDNFKGNDKNYEELIQVFRRDVLPDNTDISNIYICGQCLKCVERIFELKKEAELVRDQINAIIHFLRNGMAKRRDGDGGGGKELNEEEELIEVKMEEPEEYDDNLSFICYPDGDDDPLGNCDGEQEGNNDNDADFEVAVSTSSDEDFEPEEGKIIRAQKRKRDSGAAPNNKDNKSSLSCSICGAIFTTPRLCLIHVETVHENTRQYKCPICPLAFKDKYYIKRHIKRQHSNAKTVEEKKKCPTCGETFPNIKERIIHQRSVHLSKPIFACGSCGFIATQKSRLDKHLQRSKKCGGTGKKKIMKKVNDPGECTPDEHFEIGVPLTTTTTDLKQSCSYCDSTFKDPKSLRTHIESVHRNARNFKCHLCPSTFGIKRYLNRHLVRHTKTKTLEQKKKCKVCGETFPNIKQRILHQRTLHFSKPTFSCKICGLVLTQKCRLDKHLIRSKKCSSANIEEEDWTSSCAVVEEIASNESLGGGDTGCQQRVDLVEIKIEEPDKSIQEQQQDDNISFICYPDKEDPLRNCDDDNSDGREEEELCDNDDNDADFELPISMSSSDEDYEPEEGKTIRTKKRRRDFYPDREEKEAGLSCSICTATFSSQRLRLIHFETVHENTRPYKCPTCPLAFKDKYYIKRHIKRHTTTITATPPNYSCTLCDSTFKNPRDLRIHIEAVHKNLRKHKCHLCPSAFKVKHYLNAHLLRHGKTKTLEQKKKCSVCDETFPNIKERILHQRTLHFSKPTFSCKICGLVLTQKCRLTKHLLRSKKCASAKIDDKSEDPVAKQQVKVPKPPVPTDYTCQDCGDTFTSKMLHRMHIESVHQHLRKFQCALCPRAFLDKPALNKHMTLHNLTRQEKKTCSTCGESFPNITARIIHERSIHLLKPVFSCVTCYVVFTSKSKLERHLLRSTSCVAEEEAPQPETTTTEEPSPLICHICGKSYTSKTTLRTHILGVHEKVKKHHCNLCPKSFLARNDLARHKKRMHVSLEERKRCSTCGESFAEVKLRIVHERSVHLGKETFLCDSCPNVFHCRSKLDQHSLRCGKDRAEINQLKKFVCEICGLRFLLKNHLTKHIGAVHEKIRKWECDFCSDTFYTNGNLLEHVDRKHRSIEERKKCGICGEYFATLQEKCVHERSVHLNKPIFSCEFCPAVFDINSSLQKHLNSHK